MRSRLPPKKLSLLIQFPCAFPCKLVPRNRFLAMDSRIRHPPCSRKRVRGNIKKQGDPVIGAPARTPLRENGNRLLPGYWLSQNSPAWNSFIAWTSAPQDAIGPSRSAPYSAVSRRSEHVC